MDRQRREEELKGRSSKKGLDTEQSILNRVLFFFFLHSLLPFLLFLLRGGGVVAEVVWFSLSFCQRFHLFNFMY